MPWETLLTSLAFFRCVFVGTVTPEELAGDYLATQPLQGCFALFASGPHEVLVYQFGRHDVRFRCACLSCNVRPTSSLILSFPSFLPPSVPPLCVPVPLCHVVFSLLQEQAEDSDSEWKDAGGRGGGESKQGQEHQAVKHEMPTSERGSSSSSCLSGKQTPGSERQRARANKDQHPQQQQQQPAAPLGTPAYISTSASSGVIANVGSRGAIREAVTSAPLAAGVMAGAAAKTGRRFSSAVPRGGGAGSVPADSRSHLAAAAAVTVAATRADTGRALPATASAVTTGVCRVGWLTCCVVFLKKMLLFFSALGSGSFLLFYAEGCMYAVSVLSLVCTCV